MDSYSWKSAPLDALLFRAELGRLEAIVVAHDFPGRDFGTPGSASRAADPPGDLLLNVAIRIPYFSIPKYFDLNPLRLFKVQQ